MKTTTQGKSICMSADSYIWEALKLACNKFDCKPAICFGDETWSYKKLIDSINEVRQWLISDVKEGPILFVPQNRPASLVFMLGSIASRKMPIFCDPSWTATELEKVIHRCAVKAIVMEGNVPQGLVSFNFLSSLRNYQLFAVNISQDELSPVRVREDVAFGRFTSGTTAFSRCLQFSEEAALNAARNWQEAAGISSEDRILCLATLNNGLAFNTSLLSVLLVGATLILHPGRLVFSSLSKNLRAFNPSILVAFPFIYQLLVSKEHISQLLSHLRLAVSSAAPLSLDVLDIWKKQTGLGICNYYGLVEVGPCTFNDGLNMDSLGVPLPGVQIRITDNQGFAVPPEDVGQIRIKTQSMASDYLDTQAPSFASHIDEYGYYMTQDRGLLTKEGHLILKGRLGRMINIAGRKIDPEEVEETLHNLSGVNDVFVRAETSSNRTVVAAYIESCNVTRDEVVAFCLERLAPYKRPQIINIMHKFPRSSTGKILLTQIDGS